MSSPHFSMLVQTFAASRDDNGLSRLSMCVLYCLFPLIC